MEHQDTELDHFGTKVYPYLDNQSLQWLVQILKVEGHDYNQNDRNRTLRHQDSSKGD